MKRIGFALGLALASGCCGIANAATAAPPPVPSALDEKETWREHMKLCAEYEWRRLDLQTFDASREGEHFKRDRLAFTLAPGVTLALVKIRAGEYTEGLSKEQVDMLVGTPNRRADSHTWRSMYPEGVSRKVSLEYDYFISEVLITNAMFKAFAKETDYLTAVTRYRTGWIVDEKAKWRQGIGNDWTHPPLGAAIDDHPVVQVSWFDAMFFAHWLSAKFGMVFRPPTKDEWLLAAYPPSMSRCVSPGGTPWNSPRNARTSARVS